jgi:hypothetical protein
MGLDAYLDQRVRLRRAMDEGGGSLTPIGSSRRTFRRLIARRARRPI